MSRLVEKFPLAAKAVVEASGLDETVQPLRELDQIKVVNHFLLGADPEFMATGGRSREAYWASNLGLNETTVIGADHCGRQFELRPQPSKFALEVVAGMVDILRLTAETFPELLGYKWVCPAFLGVEDCGDGIGGHVHFGRKQKSRLKEVQSLDEMTRRLIELGTFDKKAFEARQVYSRGAGGAFRDAYGNPIEHYGRFGDVRTQKHGYEYRTFPSWLCSPWQAYFVLVIAKLLVHEPRLIPSEEMRRTESWVKNLFLFFQDKDVDARLALEGLRIYGIPQAHGGDFKPHWGLPTDGVRRGRVGMLPKQLPPARKTLEELVGLLVKGIPLPHRGTVEERGLFNPTVVDKKLKGRRLNV